jgi:hypothetical protein
MLHKQATFKFVPRINWVLIQSFNGKPQASSLDFAYACGSPLNEEVF